MPLVSRVVICPLLFSLKLRLPCEEVGMRSGSSAPPPLLSSRRTYGMHHLYSVLISGPLFIALSLSRLSSFSSFPVAHAPRARMVYASHEPDLSNHIPTLFHFHILPFFFIRGYLFLHVLLFIFNVHSAVRFNPSIPPLVVLF